MTRRLDTGSRRANQFSRGARQTRRCADRFIPGHQNRHTREGGYPVITAVHEIRSASEYWIIRIADDDRPITFAVAMDYHSRRPRIRSGRERAAARRSPSISAFAIAFAPGDKDDSVFCSGPLPDPARRRRGAGVSPYARSGAARRAMELQAVLARRASQHDGHRQRRDGGGDRPCRRRHDDHPRRFGRHHAAEPFAAGDRRTVRHAGVALSRAASISGLAAPPEPISAPRAPCVAIWRRPPKISRTTFWSCRPCSARCSQTRWCARCRARA